MFLPTKFAVEVGDVSGKPPRARRGAGKLGGNIQNFVKPIESMSVASATIQPAVPKKDDTHESRSNRVSLVAGSPRRH